MAGKRLAPLAVKDLNSEGYPEVYVFYLCKKAAPSGDGFEGDKGRCILYDSAEKPPVLFLNADYFQIQFYFFV